MYEGCSKKDRSLQMACKLPLLTRCDCCGSLAASFDNRLLFPAFHYMQYLLSCSLRSEQMRHTFGGSNYKRTWGTMRNLFVNCWSELMGRNAWVIHNATSVSKRVEHQSVKTPGLDDHLHQQTTTISREFVSDSWKSSFDSPKRLLRRWASV